MGCFNATQKGKNSGVLVHSFHIVYIAQKKKKKDQGLVPRLCLLLCPFRAMYTVRKQNTTMCETKTRFPCHGSLIFIVITIAFR